MVHRARFPWRRGAAVGLTSWPRSSFHRPPAKADGLREDQGAFHRSSRARAGVAPFACPLGLSVTPPQRGIASVRPAPLVPQPSASPRRAKRPGAAQSVRARGCYLVALPAAAPFRFLRCVLARGLMCRELLELLIDKPTSMHNTKSTPQSLFLSTSCPPTFSTACALKTRNRAEFGACGGGSEGPKIGADSIDCFV